MASTPNQRKPSLLVARTLSGWLVRSVGLGLIVGLIFAAFLRFDLSNRFYDVLTIGLLAALAYGVVGWLVGRFISRS